MTDNDYKDKLAKCFDMRSNELKKKQFYQQKKWNEATAKEKNYINYKKGYKHMLDDISHAKMNMQKFKRGLSIFSDETIKNTLTT